MQVADHNILALDVGNRRIGLAVANALARLPRPLTTLEQNEGLWDRLGDIVRKENIAEIVVGLPRNLNGEDTQQTQIVRDFVSTLQEKLTLPIHFQDEALTSRQAESELNLTKKGYSKADIDALAATLILEDYLDTRHNGAGHA